MKILLSCMMLSFAFPAFAAEPVAFTMDKAHSHIRFEAVQNHAPVQGGFGDFTADIRFHPDALDKSHVTVTVDTASIHAGYDEATSTLRTADWFDTETFPQAVFEAARFTALGDNRYRAEGSLRIKEQAHPVTLDFTLDRFSETAAHMTGETILKRTDFDIGWADTATVEDTVKVQVEITASAAGANHTGADE